MSCHVQQQQQQMQLMMSKQPSMLNTLMRMPLGERCLEILKPLYQRRCKFFTETYANCKASVEEQQRQVCRLDMRVDHLEMGLDEKISKKVAELTPPATPRGIGSAGSNGPPGFGVGFATAQPFSVSAAGDLSRNRLQRTIVVWGFQWNSHRQTVVAELQRCLLSLKLDVPPELFAPFLRGSKAHCVFQSREAAEHFKDRFNQSAKETDTWKHLRAGYERSDSQRKRAAALRTAKNALCACISEERHQDAEICYTSGRFVPWRASSWSLATTHSTL